METNPLLQSDNEFKEMQNKIKAKQKIISKIKKKIQNASSKSSLKISGRVSYGIKPYGSEYNRMKILQAIAKQGQPDNMLNEPNVYVKKHRGDNSIRMFGKYRR